MQYKRGDSLKNFILYWRIFVIVALVVLLLMKVISQFTFLSLLSGIIVFFGIPWLYTNLIKE
jgi:thiol:disulfide interchange protein